MTSELAGESKTYYTFETAGGLVPFKKTWAEITEQINKGVKAAQLIVEESTTDSNTSEEEKLLLFSDKRVKGIVKAKAKKQATTTSTKKQRKSNCRKPRYFIPLMFNAPDGKTVIRRMKILDMRDDRKYESMTQIGWE